MILLFGCINQQQIEKNKVKSPEPSVISNQPQNDLAPSENNLSDESNSIAKIETENWQPGTGNRMLDTGNSSGPLPTAQGSMPRVYFFYSPYCNASQAIWPEIERLEGKYNNSVVFRKYSVTNSGDLGEYNKFAIEYNLSNRVVPIVYFKNETLIGRFEINDSLENLIKETISN